MRGLPTRRRARSGNILVALVACAVASIGVAPAGASIAAQDVGHSCGIGVGVGYALPGTTCQFYCLYGETVHVYVLGVGGTGAWGLAVCGHYWNGVPVIASCTVPLLQLSCEDAEGPNVDWYVIGTCEASLTAIQVQCWAR